MVRRSRLLGIHPALCRPGCCGSMNSEYLKDVTRYLNDLCEYCGARQSRNLRRGCAVWIDRHSTWRSPVTRRNVIAIVLAAFNLAQGEHGVRNPLKGLKNPPPDHGLRQFRGRRVSHVCPGGRSVSETSFAAIHTGLRPFCELAKLTSEQIDETARGMMWRVYSTKTKKTRRIPVRPEVAKIAQIDADGTQRFRQAALPRRQGQRLDETKGQGPVPHAPYPARLGSGCRAAAILMQFVPAHLRSSHVVRVIGTAAPVARSRSSPTDGQHPEGRLCSLWQAMGPALSRTAVGRDRQ